MTERRPPAVARVIERATQTARAHQMFHAGELVLVWVSGGADSLCLLETLVRVRRLFRIKVAVFHFDHELQPGSAADAGYVVRRAAAHGLACHVRRPLSRPAPGDSVERWAREERHRAGGAVASEISARRSALGHTQDDRAETVLLALVRGWGLDGLTGMEPVTGDLIRPLLEVRRDETEACCRALRLRPRVDPSNADLSLLRNALRRRALPALAEATGRDVVPTIARTAELLRADAVLLDELASELGAGIVEQSASALTFSATRLLELARPVSSRVVRRGFAEAGVPWTERAIDAVLDLAAGRPGRRLELADGWRAHRDRTRVVLER